MGVKLKDFIEAQTIKIENLRGKVCAVDAHNTLYQFLTTIRQRDGMPLVNKEGKVTSHLNGLFYRCTKFMEKGLKLVFVFDGKPPALKITEIQRRAEIKKEAQRQYEEAEKKGDIESMRKFASRTTRLTKDMIEESKELLGLLGIPVVQAPSEGEAQAAYMTKKGDAFAVVSQDYDSLLGGSERLVRNLSIEGRRKRSKKLQYDIVRPELIMLSNVLNTLGIDQDQLIVMGMLIGTDYNPKGVPGIGPKNALKLVKKEDDFDKLFEGVKWGEHHDVAWEDIFYTIKNMPIEKKYSLKWKPPQIDKLRDRLIGKYSFSVGRIDNKLQKFVEEREKNKQTGLGQWS
jgi:flap endonuclease-1